MTEYADRLRRAVARLEERRDNPSVGMLERTRLGGKVEGVKLAASYLPALPSQTEKAERQVAAVEAVLERWEGVLSEVKRSDPRWILDQGVMVLGQVQAEVRAALDLRTPPPEEGSAS